MKKINIILLIIVMFLINIISVSANSLSLIDIKGKIDEYGNLHLTETWSMITNKDTEIYKEMYNMGNMTISNFKVKDEKREYTFNSNWDINASFSEKKYQYGINYVDEGYELCFGISEYGRKNYTMSYTINNAVFNTSDSQVLYLRLINDLSFSPFKFKITVEGPNYFSDNLDVWGYGYRGYAYVNSGKIYMSSEENTYINKGEYGVLLVKFPLNTFKISSNNSYSQYSNFNDVYTKAQEGTYEYDYNNGFFDKFLEVLRVIFFTVVPFILLIFAYQHSQKYKFGSLGKKINMKNINMFRDIPCKKDIYRAYFVAQAYSLNSRNTDLFGSIFLKWLNENRIKLHKVEKKQIFGTKEEVVLDFTNFGEVDNPIEYEIYNIICDASIDGILHEDEFQKYAKNNYKKILKWFEKAEEYGLNLYAQENLVTKERKKYLIDDRLKKDAIELAGLKKYLLEFSSIDTKQPMEVKLWKEYLMYAQIFGIAVTVSKQFKKLYPEVLTEMTEYGYDISDIIILNNFCNNTILTARNAAERYSSGGGGFSIGGGGGGSFGGGGGGSR